MQKARQACRRHFCRDLAYDMLRRRNTAMQFIIDRPIFRVCHLRRHVKCYIIIPCMETEKKSEHLRPGNCHVKAPAAEK